MSKARDPLAPWAAGERELLRRRLEAIATPERAEQERAYLHSEREHLGVSQPGVRAIAGDYWRADKGLARERILALTKALWASEVHELRSVAIALLERWRRRLEVDDLAWLELWLRQSLTWAHVDWLAVKVVGPIVAAAPDESAAVLDRWAGDDDFWLRRAAMLALLEPLRKGGGDVERFFTYAAAMIDEREFFIRKAIGWILRELGRKRPALTLAFVEEHVGTMAGLTLREAIKSLPEADGARLKAAHAAGRRAGRASGS